MPISDHPSFSRPTVGQRLWRYMDLPKFIDLITSRNLWLTNAEVLAIDDPHEGLQGAIQFPHRMWNNIEDVPDVLRRQIVERRHNSEEMTEEQAFRNWFMLEEQHCFMTQSGRRNFYINCWHMAEFESAAMWKIYSSPGAGIAIISSAGRLHTALENAEEDLHFGAVEYVHPLNFEIGSPNAFNPIVKKRSNFSYEQEARLVHWHKGNYHDPLEHFAWNDESMRFDNILENPEPITPGISVKCDVATMIEHVIVSPFAPPWYLPMINRLLKDLGYELKAYSSNLLVAPHIIE